MFQKRGSIFEKMSFEENVEKYILKMKTVFDIFMLLDRRVQVSHLFFRLWHGKTFDREKVLLFSIPTVISQRSSFDIFQKHERMM